jgi:hypothetical protein
MHHDPSQPSAAQKSSFRSISPDGEVLTLPLVGFPTVLLRQDARARVPDLIWTIRSVAARCLLDYVRIVGFEFSVGKYFHPRERVWVPVLLFRMAGGKQMLAYTLGLIGEDEFSDFFGKFAEIDLLLTDTAITTRDHCCQLPVPPSLLSQLGRGVAAFHSEPDQKSTIQALKEESR